MPGMVGLEHHLEIDVLARAKEPEEAANVGGSVSRSDSALHEDVGEGRSIGTHGGLIGSEKASGEPRTDSGVLLGEGANIGRIGENILGRPREAKSAIGMRGHGNVPVIAEAGRGSSEKVGPEATVHDGGGGETHTRKVGVGEGDKIDETDGGDTRAEPKSGGGRIRKLELKDRSVGLEELEHLPERTAVSIGRRIRDHTSEHRYVVEVIAEVDTPVAFVEGGPGNQVEGQDVHIGPIRARILDITNRVHKEHLLVPDIGVEGSALTRKAEVDAEAKVMLALHDCAGGAEIEPGDTGATAGVMAAAVVIAASHEGRM